MHISMILSKNIKGALLKSSTCTVLSVEASLNTLGTPPASEAQPKRAEWDQLRVGMLRKDHANMGFSLPKKRSTSLNPHQSAKSNSSESKRL